MKRILEACLCQTIRFSQREEPDTAKALAMSRQEVAEYRNWLERNRLACKITEETEEPDGSIVVKVMRQYNSYETGSWLEA